MSLVKLPPTTVKLITSSQIITSVSSAVKELMENSLDAGATNVDVKLINNGLDRLEVKDNGCGISRIDAAHMAQPNFTSKITNFSDLESLQSYGFRGEALNALCRVAQVTVTTATTTDPVAMTYTLDNGGNIVSSKPFHLVQGTTVAVSNIFKNLPVRRQFLGSGRRAQEELKQVEATVKSLAIIRPNIRVTLTHNKCLVWQKNPCSSLQNSFSQLIGYSVSQQMEELTLMCKGQVTMEMLVPKKQCDISAVCRSSPIAWSLVYVNQRLVTYKKIMKVLHQHLSRCFGDHLSSKKHAACLISITADPSQLDVNLEPNKTQVLLSEEDVIIEQMEKKLREYYDSPPSATPGSESLILVCREPSNEMISDVQEEPSDIQQAVKRRKIDETDSSDAQRVNHTDNGVSLNSSSFKKGSFVRKSEQPFLVSLNDQPSSAPIENPLKLQAHPAPHFLDGDPESCNEGSVSKIKMSNHCDGSEVMTASDNNALSELTCSHKLAGNSTSGIQTNEFPSSEKRLSLSGGLKDMNSDSSRNTFSSAFIDPQVTVNESDKTGINLSNVNETAKNTTNEHTCQTVHDQSSFKAIDPSADLWGDLCMDEISSLDVFASQSETPIITSTQHDQGVRSLEQGLKRPDDVSYEKWSMGHLQSKNGGLVQGSCVLVQGSNCKENEREMLKPASSVPVSSKNIEVVAHKDKGGKISPVKSPPKNSVDCGLKRSPRSSRCSTMEGLDASLQSVSSQMGRKELAAFTKFSRDVRPQLILDNPGIAFTRVASILAEKWQALSVEERDHYEELARHSATTRRIWQTASNQQKLSWGKTLPHNDKKAENTETVKPKPVKPGKLLRGPPERPLREEVTLDFSVEKLHQKIKQIAQMRKTSSDTKRIILVGQLETSGHWICLESQSRIYLLSHCRLQEVVVNHRLLETYRLPIIPLSTPQTINPQVLGNAAWSALLSLPRGVDNLSTATVVSADVITKNGFRIEIFGGGDSATLTHVAETINFYGMKELKEILDLYSKQESPSVSQCRPLRVINHIKGEAVRICRNSPSIMERAMAEELLEYWETLMPRRENQCLHFKPLFTEIFNLSREVHQSV